MVKRNVLVELIHTKKIQNNTMTALAAADTTLGTGVAPKMTSLTYDAGFAPVALPKLSRGVHPPGELYDTLAAMSFDATPEVATYLVRGSVEEENLPALQEEAKQNPSVVAVYSDVTIQPMIVCPGTPPLGTDADVERLLCTVQMHNNHMDGAGVLVAVVDTGFNLAYLNAHGKNPNFDLARSWSWNPASVTPGSAAVDHGTMCAFDICIAAPKCTLLDIALLHGVSVPPGGTFMNAMLSDAIRAYSYLLNLMTGARRPGENPSLVVNNSWGMFNPSWDFPVGNPGNYSDNPDHPFNRIVATLERAGADILFAAGNCGPDCPDSRCSGVTTNVIYGANSSPSVLCVAGVDTTQARVGYSSVGPGRLTDRKPDICGYTHFRGSGVYAADGGTSAATPVITGVIAAIRSVRSYNSSDTTTSPAAIRNLVTTTAIDLGPTGYDYQYGYGVVDGCKLATKVGGQSILQELCRRFPWICQRFGTPDEICRRYPWLCKGAVSPTSGSTSTGSGTLTQLEETVQPFANAIGRAPEEIAYLLGFLHSQEATKSGEQK